MPVPEISLKCPDNMSEQAQNCSDIMEFWSDIDRNYIVFCYQLAGTLCPSKLIFGQTTAKNGRKLSDVQCNFRLCHASIREETIQYIHMATTIIQYRISGNFDILNFGEFSLKTF